MKELSEVKDSLDMEVKQNFIDPLQNLHDKDLREIQVLPSTEYFNNAKCVDCLYIQNFCYLCSLKWGTQVWRDLIFVSLGLNFAFQFCVSCWWFRKGKIKIWTFFDGRIFSLMQAWTQYSNLTIWKLISQNRCANVYIPFSSVWQMHICISSCSSQLSKAFILLDTCGWKTSWTVWHNLENW